MISQDIVDICSGKINQFKTQIDKNLFQCRKPLKCRMQKTTKKHVVKKKTLCATITFNLFSHLCCHFQRYGIFMGNILHIQKSDFGNYLLMRLAGATNMLPKCLYYSGLTIPDKFKLGMLTMTQECIDFSPDFLKRISGTTRTQLLLLVSRLLGQILQSSFRFSILSSQQSILLKCIYQSYFVPRI